MISKITLITDFTCPFCFRQHLALSALKEEGIAPEIHPAPHMLKADAPIEGFILDDKLREKLRHHFEELKKDPLFEGIHFHDPERRFNSYRAHGIALAAEKEGIYLPVALAIFEAGFVRGENIALEETLKKAIDGAGFDYDTLASKVNAEDLRAGLHESFALRKKYELKTVPAMYFPETERVVDHSTSLEELRDLVTEEA